MEAIGEVLLFIVLTLFALFLLIFISEELGRIIGIWVLKKYSHLQPQSEFNNPSPWWWGSIAIIATELTVLIITVSGVLDIPLFAPFFPVQIYWMIFGEQAQYPLPILVYTIVFIIANAIVGFVNILSQARKQLKKDCKQV